MSAQVSDRPNEEHLCEDCRGLTFYDKALGGTQAHRNDGTSYLTLDNKDGRRIFKLEYHFEDTHPDFPRLAGSGRSACYCCKWLRKCILRAEVKPPRHSSHVVLCASYAWRSVVVPRDSGLVALLLEVNFKTPPELLPGSNSTSSPVIQLNVDSDSESCISWLRMLRSPRAEALDPENIALIQQTQMEVEGARASQDELGTGRGFLPTRLIDLGHKEDPSPRLVLSRDIAGTISSREVRYAALSYCWGSPVEAAAQFKTTHGVLAKRLTSIDINTTTAVIRDAAQVCKALDIRYLWVDSVCILQDGMHDWERESPQMVLIYNNAAITICPLSSISCTQGFLDRTGDSIRMPFCSQIHPNIVGHYKLRYKGLLDSNSLSTFIACNEYDDLVDSRWLTRGWTFQEMHSSKCIVFFGTQRVHLMTSNGLLIESQKELVSMRPEIAWLNTQIPIQSDDSYEFLCNRWMDLVQGYSGRQLSHATDKLPALSGLANYFQGRLDDSYIVGMWEGDLIRELLWSSSDTFTDMENLMNSFRPSPYYIAPSWSWISQNHEIQFSHYHPPTIISGGSYKDYKPEYKYLIPSVTLNSSGANKFGRIDDASLTIASRSFRVQNAFQRISDRYGIIMPWHVKGEGDEYLANCSLDWEDGRSADHQLELLLLGSCKGKYEQAGRDQRHAWGLLICSAEKLDVHGVAQFYRVGTFYSNPKDGGGLAVFETCPEKTVCLI